MINLITFHIRADDISTLEAATDETLAIWWSELNNFEWPADLADEEPKEYMPRCRRIKLMNWISDRIGMKECLRYWNRENMPGAEFDRWYNKSSWHNQSQQQEKDK